MHKRKNKYKTQNKIVFLCLLLIVSIMTIGFASFQTNITINTKGNLKHQKWNFDYTGSSQEFIVPENGKYQIELWGASGATKNENVGNAGYTRGIINLEKNKKVCCVLNLCC